MEALKKDLQKLAQELEGYCTEYHQEGTPTTATQGIYRGKYAAYGYAAKKIQNILQWHGLTPDNDTVSNR